MSFESEDDNTSILYHYKWKPIHGKTVNLIVSDEPWYDTIDMTINNNNDNFNDIQNEKSSIDIFGIVLFIITLICVIYYVSLGYADILN